MKRYKFVNVLIVSLIIGLPFLGARSFRVNQIPNGTELNCTSCHVSPAGGGARTAFGQDVLNGFLVNDNVNWGPSLAALDSDGDGFTNGAELQDPNGEWTSGMPAPGTAALVTNPGDPDDFPEPTDIEDHNFNMPVDFALQQNYPNPFNPSTNITFHLNEGANVTLDIFSLTGEKVNTLVNDYFSAGSHSVKWNGVNSMGNKVNSGVYVYRLSNGVVSESKTMVLMK